MNLQALKTELTTDPVGVGYAAANGDHVALAKLINTAQRQVGNEGQRPTSELLNVFAAADVVTAVATPAKAAMLQMLLSLATIDPDSKGIRAWVASIFGNPSATLTEFNKYARSSGTRAEELGFGRVTESHVADALRS